MGVKEFLSMVYTNLEIPGDLFKDTLNDVPLCLLISVGKENGRLSAGWYLDCSVV
jgi:hypothetical protein